MRLCEMAAVEGREAKGGNAKRRVKTRASHPRSRRSPTKAELRATCPISRIYANRHPRGWLLTFSSSRTLRFFPRLCLSAHPPLPTPRFIPLLIRCRYTCADVSRRHRHRRLVQKMQTAKIQVIVDLDARKALAFLAHFPLVSPFFFAIAPEGKCVSCLTRLFGFILYRAEVHRISVRQHPIPFLLSCRHEMKEGGIFGRKHLYVSMYVAESSASGVLSQFALA